MTPETLAKRISWWQSRDKTQAALLQAYADGGYPAISTFKFPKRQSHLAFDATLAGDEVAKALARRPSTRFSPSKSI